MGKPKSQSVCHDIFAEDSSSCKTCNVIPDSIPSCPPKPTPAAPSEIPGDYVQDSDYVHTDNNFTDAYKEKIDELVDNAQSDWTETDVESPTYIKNKPDNLVQDAHYVHTDNNFSNEDVTKLNSIEAGAEVNVQSDWNETDTTSDAYIKNKPNIVGSIKDNFVAGINQIEVAFKSSEFGEYPLLRAYNNWSVELFGETSYVSYSDLNGNDRKAIMKFYSNGVQTIIQENGFYILGA